MGSYKLSTSTPVVRTGVIPTCRSPSPPSLARLSHGPRDCPASLSHLTNDRPWLTPGPKFTKRDETWWTPTSTILQNFIALCQPTPEISVTKILRTKKQTVNDISPKCLSACGDNKNSPVFGPPCIILYVFHVV